MIRGSQVKISQQQVRHDVGSDAGKSELHHGSANNVALSQQIKVLVDFIKWEDLEDVTNLVLGGKRHNLTQVRVVGPKRAMKRLFAMHARE